MVVFSGFPVNVQCLPVIASVLNIVDVVFNYAVDHIMSNISRKCTN